MESVEDDMLKKLPLNLRIEIEENLLRKSFTQTELAMIQKKLIAELSKPDYKNQGKRGDTSTRNLVGAENRKNHYENTTEKVARLFGESEPTLRERLSFFEQTRDDSRNLDLIVKKSMAIKFRFIRASEK